MVDAVSFWDVDGPDIKINDNDLVIDGGLVSAIMNSLFTDGRATDEELPFGEADKRGVWSDHITNERDDFKFESLLWTLGREKLTDEVAERARGFCLRATEYFVNRGIVQSRSFSAEIVKPTGLLIRGSFVRPQGREFDYLWGDVAGVKRDVYLGETLLTLDIDLG